MRIGRRFPATRIGGCSSWFVWRPPALLIFDSKLTTQAVLAELDDRGIGFITLRARHPGVTQALPPCLQAPGST